MSVSSRVAVELSLPERTTLTETMRVRISPRDKERLGLVIAAMGERGVAVSESRIIRDALLEFLDRALPTDET